MAESSSRHVECDHIWDRLHEIQGSIIKVMVQNMYICRDCKVTINTEDQIPCVHEWEKIKHTLGSNYVKEKCLHCGEISVIYAPCPYFDRRNKGIKAVTSNSK